MQMEKKKKKDLFFFSIFHIKIFQYELVNAIQRKHGSSWEVTLCPDHYPSSEENDKRNTFLLLG